MEADADGADDAELEALADEEAEPEADAEPDLVADATGEVAVTVWHSLGQEVIVTRVVEYTV